MKKILALLVAVLMLVGMTAALADTYTIASPSEEDVVTDHTYVAYQILTATNYNTTEHTFGNLDWASDDIEALLNDPAGTYADAQAFATALTGTNDSAAALALAQTFLNSDVKGTGTSITNGETVLGKGLWLIVDESNAGAVKVINMANLYASDGTTAVSIVSKVDAPSREKKVKDINDSADTPTYTDLQDSADYDIGDSIPYTLKATLPGNYADYDTYYLKFSDDMSAGLTYNDDAKIYFGDSDTTGQSITLTPVVGTSYTGGQLYEYVIADLKTSNASFTSGTIRIEYTATLNASAVLGSAGNPNKYKIEYSNNPNTDGDGDHGTTPWDINIVFTYKTVFNKVDGDNNPLPDADFELYKKVAGEWVNVTALHGTEAGTINPTKTVTSGTQFTFSGLDDGDYKLVETATPAGYNSIDDIEFTITATHDIISDNPALNTLTGTDGDEFILTPDLDEGSLTGPITNLSGVTLPSTGGIGTTIFYVGGSILVLAAVILLVTKRRMNAEK